MLPSLFVAHGSPMLAVEDNVYSRFLQQLGAQLPRPRAIVLFSAHWESRVQKLTANPVHAMMYDFWGFPDALYQIVYKAMGDAALAQEIGALLTQAGVTVESTLTRGLDHGAWVVLRRMFPAADVPVIAMSVDPHLSPREQYALGQALVSLRAQDVLVIGSGGSVHNLRAVSFDDPEKVDDFAVGFDHWLEERLLTWDLDALVDYAALAPFASMAVPPGGNEHFVPLFYALGAADDSRRATLLHRSYQYGSLSHSVWQFG